MDKENTNQNTNQNLFECLICLDSPKNPVATTCGHVFCWKCLKTWLANLDKHICPLCKNGVDLKKVVRLYSNNQGNDDPDDMPKTERVDPVRNTNNRGFVIN
jgi:hypothetical protein